MLILPRTSIPTLPRATSIPTLFRRPIRSAKALTPCQLPFRPDCRGPGLKKILVRRRSRASRILDGSLFALNVSGQNIGGGSDQFHFQYVPLKGDRSITARFVPPVPSQFAKLGLMIRSGLEASSASAAILITPELTRDVEQPGWYVRLALCAADGTTADDAAAPIKLESPVVDWGRLMSAYWLRLVRSGDRITALSSADGQTWNKDGRRLSPLEWPALYRAGCLFRP